MALSEIGRQGWNLLREDMPLPLMVLKRDALAQNRRWMRAFRDATGTEVAPHGKTTMSPQLFQLQMEDGSWGITCATVEQLQVYRQFGVSRVLFANQLVGAKAIDFVLDELERDPGFTFYAFADSVAGVELLARRAEARRIGQPLRLLVEVGQQEARTGARTAGAALTVARAIANATPWLALSGLGTYEGVVAGADDRAMEPNVGRIFDLAETVVKQCANEGLFANDRSVLMTAGGSQFPDVAAHRLKAIDIGRPTLTVIRSGCYLTHDSGRYDAAIVRMAERDAPIAEAGGGLAPALELWAYIQSRPEPHRAFATFGKRDTGNDLGVPAPLLWFRPGVHRRPERLLGCSVLRMNDQHAHLDIPADSPLVVGDMVAFGISHPCTTFDKWQVIPIVDADYSIVDAIRTFF
jgi:D-serine dehydratase